METNKKGEASITFVGTGSSSGTPMMECLVKGDCKTCEAAKTSPTNINRRGNPSLVINFSQKNILIDCGKSFKERMVQCMVKKIIPSIDGVIITHAHSDAYLGLDDLREWSSKDHKIPIYLRTQDLKQVNEAFPYLVDIDKATSSGYTSLVEFIEVDPNKPFTVPGDLEVVPIEVVHGSVTCMGFIFPQLGVVYISDVSKVPTNVIQKIETIMNPIKTLIIDALHVEKENSGHFNLPQALDAIRQMKPVKTYLIGMSHSFYYEEHNPALQKLKESEGLDIELSYDGMILNFETTK